MLKYKYCIRVHIHLWIDNKHPLKWENSLYSLNSKETLRWKKKLLVSVWSAHQTFHSPGDAHSLACDLKRCLWQSSFLWAVLRPAQVDPGSRESLDSVLTHALLSSPCQPWLDGGQASPAPVHFINLCILLAILLYSTFIAVFYWVSVPPLQNTKVILTIVYSRATQLLWTMIQLDKFQYMQRSG